MSRPFYAIATLAAGALIALAMAFVLGFFDKLVTSVTDIAVGETVEYHDFHTCRLPDGSTAYDFHFGGVDRSRRAQFISRHDNMGRRTLRVTDRAKAFAHKIPPGHVRLVLEMVPPSNLEGHNFGTAWSREVLLINPRRPIERAVNIPPCGPARQ